MGKPSREQLALQTELRRLQSVRRQDEEEFDNQKQVLQAQLQSEVSHISTSLSVGNYAVSFIFYFLCFHEILSHFGGFLLVLTEPYFNHHWDMNLQHKHITKNCLKD